MSSRETIAVSVVVPAFNAATTIGACLDSVLRQELPGGGVEVIVVDNGSTDATPSVLRGFGDAVRVLHEPRRGASAARNHGVREAKGGIVAFIDADAVASPGWLASLIEPLCDLSVGVSGGPILSIEPGNRISRFGERIKDQFRSIQVEDHPYVDSCNWASRRDVLVEAGLFDPGLLRGQDVDLAWRISQARYRLAYAPDAVVRHVHERTIAGLVHEGFTHGVHAQHLLAKHGLPRARIRARLRRAVRHATAAEDAFDGLLCLLFDIGKSAGHAVARWRSWRNRPVRSSL